VPTPTQTNRVALNPSSEKNGSTGASWGQTTPPSGGISLPLCISSIYLMNDVGAVASFPAWGFSVIIDRHKFNNIRRFRDGHYNTSVQMEFVAH
jgi:hypothetical protein